MAQVRLSGVHKVTIKGRVYWYYGRGAGSVRLPNDPGSVAFAEALEAARQPGREALASPTIAGLCARYRSRAWWRDAGEPGCIALSTRRNWSPWLDRIQTHFGPLRVAAFDRPAIRPAIASWRGQWLDRPRAFDYAKQVLSALLAFAVDQGELVTNPCVGLRNAYSADRSAIIWTKADLEQLAEHASPQVIAAARLAALTGLRAGDLFRLPWSRVGKLAIELRTGKSRGRRTALVPLYGELAAFLEALPRVGPIVLVNAAGAPWRTGFTSSWNKALKRAGLTGLHFHDLRGTAATRMFLGGLSVREIAEVLAWSEDHVERLVDRYVKRDELLRDRIRRMDESKGRPA